MMGILLCARKLRWTPSLVMTTVRMHPPEDPSRAIACDTALITNALHSSSVMFAWEQRVVGIALSRCRMASHF